MKETEYNPHCSRINEEVLLFCFGIKKLVCYEPFWMRDRPFWMYDESIWMHGGPIWMHGGPFWMRDRPRLFCIIVYQEAAKNAIFTG